MTILNRPDIHLTLRYNDGSLHLWEGNKRIAIFDKPNEELLFNHILENRPNSASGLHPNGTGFNDVAWNNFEVCLETISSKREYRTAHNIELLRYKYFLYATSTMQPYPDGLIIEIASPEAVIRHIESITTDDVFTCFNWLQVVYVMELHHLKNINKSGYGETFRKCEKCGRYFITRNEIYCSDNCKAKAKSEQMKKVSKDPKTHYLKKIRDRYNIQIARHEEAKNTKAADKLRKELKTFQSERKKLLRQVKENKITEQQYIDWLKDRESKKGERDNG